MGPRVEKSSHEIPSSNPYYFIISDTSGVPGVKLTVSIAFYQLWVTAHT